jgi:hypothetical protein
MTMAVWCPAFAMPRRIETMIIRLIRIQRMRINAALTCWHRGTTSRLYQGVAFWIYDEPTHLMTRSWINCRIGGRWNGRWRSACIGW